MACKQTDLKTVEMYRNSKKAVKHIRGKQNKQWIFIKDYMQKMTNIKQTNGANTRGNSLF